jgi:Tfp pilus assembly protein PilF
VVSYNRALIFLYQGKYDDAMRELDRAASVEPNNPSAAKHPGPS